LVEQVSSPYLVQIPSIELFENREGLLFKKGKLVPERRMPRGLLWNPVQRAFPLSIGNVNQNLFDIGQKIDVRIVPRATEQHAAALLADLTIARDYVTASAAVRLRPLSWCIIDNNAFFVGTPLLSIPGMAYWFRAGNFIPAGYDFEFPLLGSNIHRQLDPTDENKIIWFTDSSYMLLPSKSLVPLSASSFRLSLQ
jgi:hypothetical protein